MAKLNLAAAEAAVDKSGIAEAEKDALRQDLRRAAAPVPDSWVYRIVVIALGVAIFAPLIGPAVTDEPGSMQLLLPIATGALGALAGLLAPSPASS